MNPDGFEVSKEGKCDGSQGRSDIQTAINISLRSTRRKRATIIRLNYSLDVQIHFLLLRSIDRKAKADSAAR